ncbi:DUF6068 family protein [Myxococcus dinghuensis]|uniref:DUF6068 family protein n=1 Tax=Myxococcus dinghuensis TaxID=2906761 RepID=UPI0020A7492E|nr:DUF6068 family protein [Myxococcus dinghuensis]
MSRASFPTTRLATLCATLVLGAGCESTRPRAVSPSDGAPVTQGGEEQAPPSALPPVKGNSPWLSARVGDRVAYAFSANRTPLGNARAMAAAGVVALEVVALEPSWVWLAVIFTDDAGAPLNLPRLSRPLVLPVRTDGTRPLDVKREGVESVEQPTAAGRTWEAKRYLHDNRPVDGPLQNRLYATDVGPAYLTNGLLDASTTLSGFGGGGSYQLTLVEVRQGKEGGTGTRPELERPLGPGTWFDTRMDVEGTGPVTVSRTCLGAERGYVLRQAVPTPTSPDPETCRDLSHAEVVPLEEVLLTFVWDALETPTWPPAQPNTTPPVRETASFGAHKVPVLQFDAAEDAGPTKQIRSRVYAAGLWEPSLNGLAVEVRFGPLDDTLYRTPARGKRESAGGVRLADWGTWLP